MLFKSLVSSFALLATSVSAVEYKFYNKRQDAASPFFKREFIQITDDIAVSTSADGLTSTVVVDITYDYNISVAGYVVAPEFDLEAGDYGYTVVSEYDTASDLESNLDKWQFIHQADDGTTVLLTPDCSNLFTLLDPNTNAVLTWDVCYSIGSLAAEFSFPTTVTVTPTPTPTTVTAVGPGQGVTISSGTTVFITSDLVSTTVTVPCPICTGEPTTYYIYTTTEVVEGTVTDYVTVPCSTATGYPVTEPVGAIIYTESVTISNGVTVTETVECGCTASGMGAANTPVATGKAVATGSMSTGSSGEVYVIVPTSTEGESTYYETITTIIPTATAGTAGTAGAAAAAAAAGETVTKATATIYATGTAGAAASEAAAAAGSSTSTSPSSVMEGAAGYSTVKSSKAALLVSVLAASAIGLLLF